MFFLAVQYIEGELGFGPLASGLAFLPLTLGIFAMSRVTPRLLGGRRPAADDRDRHDRVCRELRVAEHVSATGTATPAAVFGPMLLNGLSAGLVFMPVDLDRPRAASSPSTPASASGLLQTFQQLGGAVGLAVIVLGVRRRARSRVVPPRRPGGLPHLGDDGRPGRGRRAARAVEPRRRTQDLEASDDEVDLGAAAA